MTEAEKAHFRRRGWFAWCGAIALLGLALWTDTTRPLRWGIGVGAIGVFFWAVSTWWTGSRRGVELLIGAIMFVILCAVATWEFLAK